MYIANVGSIYLVRARHEAHILNFLSFKIADYLHT